MRIAIDYDGVIAKYVKGDWGTHPFLEGAIDTIKRWIEQGHGIMVYTARHNTKERGIMVEGNTYQNIKSHVGNIPVHFRKLGDVDIFIDDTPTKMIHVDTNIGLSQVEDDWLRAVPYFEKLRDTLAKLPISKIEKAVQILEETRFDNLAIAVCGNGGSMATAQHFVCDLQKIGFMATALDSQPTLTMWANDDDFTGVFVNQLKLFCPDVVIAISGSGKSPNILEAIAWAQAVGRYSIAITGSMKYNCAAELASLAIIVPSGDYQIVEDCHLAICHYIITRLRNDNIADAVEN